VTKKVVGVFVRFSCRFIGGATVTIGTEIKGGLTVTDVGQTITAE
jgi:hypothetical protein